MYSRVCFGKVAQNKNSQISRLLSGRRGVQSLSWGREVYNFRVGIRVLAVLTYISL